MDSRLKHPGFATHFMPVDAFGSLNKCTRSLSEGYANTVLKLKFSGASGPQILSFAKSVKRKWGDVDEPSLVLALGRSATSDAKESSETCTLSSARESTDDESSSDLDLNSQLHLRNEKNESPKGLLPKVHSVINVDSSFHLQLNLSTGPAESGVTSIGPASVHNPDINETVLVDDGSTSSHWESGGSLLPAMAESAKERSFDLNESLTDAGPNQAVPALSIVTPLLKGSAACASRIVAQPHTSSFKACQFPGCWKGARGASGLCIAHGGGRRCQRTGCQKGAEGRTVYCKTHGGGRRCEFLGCTKSAEGRTDFCIAHGGGRRCGFPGGCTKAARGKSGLCIRHGGGKRCRRENCTKSAEGLSGLCIAHGGGRRCQFPQCTKGAQGNTMFCKAHGGGKRCTFLGCTKGAEGSTPLCKGHGGGKRCLFQGGGICTKSVHGGTKFCVAHGGGKRCTAADCTKSARGRTDFCVRHGGGKRCKFEGCGKSAQGSTDFCKAHGGGKRCTWRDPVQGITCDRFAREKTALCQAHTAALQDKHVHGSGATLSQEPVPSAYQQNLNTLMPETATAKEMVVNSPLGKHFHLANRGKHVAGIFQGLSQEVFVKTVVARQAAAYPFVSLQFPVQVASLPEGRVHGGNLMAMLVKGALNQGMGSA